MVEIPVSAIRAPLSCDPMPRWFRRSKSPPRGLYPPLCSGCGYDLDGADLRQRPVKCPECALSNPIVAIRGEYFSYRPVPRRRRRGVIRRAGGWYMTAWNRLTGWDEPLLNIVVRVLIVAVLLSACCCSGPGVSIIRDFRDAIAGPTTPAP